MCHGRLRTGKATFAGRVKLQGCAFRGGAQQAHAFVTRVSRTQLSATCGPQQYCALRMPAYPVGGLMSRAAGRTGSAPRGPEPIALARGLARNDLRQQHPQAARHTANHMPPRTRTHGQGAMHAYPARQIARTAKKKPFSARQGVLRERISGACYRRSKFSPDFIQTRDSQLRRAGNRVRQEARGVGRHL